MRVLRRHDAGDASRVVSSIGFVTEVVEISR